DARCDGPESFATTTVARAAIAAVWASVKALHHRQGMKSTAACVAAIAATAKPRASSWLARSMKYARGQTHSEYAASGKSRTRGASASLSTRATLCHCSSAHAASSGVSRYVGAHAH